MINTDVSVWMVWLVYVSLSDPRNQGIKSDSGLSCIIY